MKIAMALFFYLLALAALGYRLYIANKSRGVKTDVSEIKSEEKENGQTSKYDLLKALKIGYEHDTPAMQFMIDSTIQMTKFTDDVSCILNDKPTQTGQVYLGDKRDIVCTVVNMFAGLMIIFGTLILCS